MDMSEDFHQILLDEESSWKCCFATECGVYRYLRLPYEVACSSEIFQRYVEKHFGDTENLMLNYDDIMVVGETEDIHDQTVSKLMDTARNVNVKFNKDKLQYKQPEVKYVGQVFSAQGMKVDPDRIESLIALKHQQTKKNCSEL
jgi:hypothetical protein